MKAIETGRKRKEEKGNRREGQRKEGGGTCYYFLQNSSPGKFGDCGPQKVLVPRFFFLPTPQLNFLFPVF